MRPGSGFPDCQPGVRWGKVMALLLPRRFQMPFAIITLSWGFVTLLAIALIA
ncbi:MAG: hypothetical protein HLUCCA08_12530 [Rhodobacteraceae bacterium HLUCCA08]|nr:MAG: hypothetical protein HLUCCA08_12530 [Rhodobacteraceae bacterium HLUCCA08]